MCVISFYFTHTVMLVFCHAGGELCAWDDAAQTDAGDVLISLTPYMIGGSLSCCWGRDLLLYHSHPLIYLHFSVSQTGYSKTLFCVTHTPVFVCRCR